MTTTPNPTAESVIAEAMVNAGAPLMHSRVEESVAAALRRFGLLSEGAPSEAQVEAAAKTMHETRNPWFAAYGDWGAAGFEIKQAFRESARAALVAAQGAATPVNGFDTTAERVKNGGDSLHVAPVLPSSGVDEETLANLIHSTSVAHFGGLDPRVAPIVARAVAEWLKGQER